jgi:iron(II)-dependent oxidoreductase
MGFPCVPPLPPGERPTAAWLLAALREARTRTLAIVADLDDSQMMGPRLPTVNPLLWEIGHLAWFQEQWTLRTLRGEPPRLPEGDALYDSAAVPHDRRWDLPLPGRAGTLAFMEEILDTICERLTAGGEAGLRDDDVYYHLLALNHEDTHAEAFLYTRQTLGYPPPSLPIGPRPEPLPSAARATGDVEIPGGHVFLGAPRRPGFVFDNEKWEHPVHLPPFAIARSAVTQGEFAQFVDDGGYSRREWWTDAGWSWRSRVAASHPAYWRREDGWQVRRFDRIVPLEEDLPILHVNAHEVEAYCRWAGRRLPTEAEWETAAAGLPVARLSVADAPRSKRTYPWGESPPAPSLANLDAAHGGTLPVTLLPAGDSAWGCRQMLGNVWEWTATRFLPYPGFVVDPYREYSRPWFGDHRVLRGGCWATRGRLIRNTWRNFYTPDRNDVWCGFRTCAPRDGRGKEARRSGL